MFETTKIVLLNNGRDLSSKMRESPVLYFFFGLIMFFSILMFAFLGYYLVVVDTGLRIHLTDIFFMVFFVFMAKSGVDLFNNFIKPGRVTYALSTQVKHKKTITEIFYAVFTTNLFIWFVLSSLFLLFLFLFGVDIFYPLEYLYFTVGVLTSMVLTATIVITYFSTERMRLIPPLILLGFIGYIRNPLYIICISPLAVVHLFWSLNYSLSAYQNFRRKPRVNEKSQVKVRWLAAALFHKETTIFWRDNLFFSFVITSIVTGIGTGYLYLYGGELLIPESLQEMYAEVLPALSVFTGVLVVVVYTSVFPSIALFLNEEKTMWIIRHTPVDNKTLIQGKATTLLLSFSTSIPFIFYMSIFVGFNHIFFVSWLLVFSFIAGAIISIPLGVKYVGKKSDVMLLYSVTMILFALLSPIAVVGGIIYSTMSYWQIILTTILLIELFMLYLSLRLSERILRLKYPVIS